MKYKIAMIQLAVKMNDAKANFQKISKMLENAHENGAEIVVLPEMWNVGFFPKENLNNLADKNGEKTLQFLKKYAKKYNMHIVGGSVAIEEKGKFFNRSYIINKDGDQISFYDKIHCFSPSKENEVFTKGNKISFFKLGELRCGIVICYDIRFPETVRRTALQNIDILFVVAAWPLERKEHWKILNRARAIENQIFLCAVNQCGLSGETHYAGNSMLIDPLGNLITKNSEKEECIIEIIETDEILKVRKTINVYNDRVNGIDL